MANKKSQIIQSCFLKFITVLTKSNGTNIDNFLALGLCPLDIVYFPSCVIVLFKQFNKTLLLGSK